MELSPEQKKALEEQKEQCIFCKIIKGEIPTKKVYEDDKIIAILDIRPAAKGHVLVMPKEHYPIMPLIPPEDFKYLFSKVREIDGCVKDALLCKETTIFIANGQAAGQQSLHFMLHIIPREGNDGLDFLDIKGKETPEEEIKEVTNKCSVLEPMLQRNLTILGFTGKNETQEDKTQQEGRIGIPKATKEQIMQIIEQNPQIKKIILQSPEQFKQIIPKHQQLKQLFAPFDLDEIIEEVKKRNKEKGKIDLKGITDH